MRKNLFKLSASIKRHNQSCKLVDARIPCSIFGGRSCVSFLSPLLYLSVRALGVFCLRFLLSEDGTSDHLIQFGEALQHFNFSVLEWGHSGPPEGLGLQSLLISVGHSKIMSICWEQLVLRIIFVSQLIL